MEAYVRFCALACQCSVAYAFVVSLVCTLCFVKEQNLLRAVGWVGGFCFCSISPHCQLLAWHVYNGVVSVFFIIYKHLKTIPFVATLHFSLWWDPSKHEQKCGFVLQREVVERVDNLKTSPLEWVDKCIQGHDESLVIVAMRTFLYYTFSLQWHSFKIKRSKTQHSVSDKCLLQTNQCLLYFHYDRTFSFFPAGTKVQPIHHLI